MEDVIFVLSGGLTAVMYTDTFQTLVMVVGSAVVMVTSKFNFTSSVSLLLDNLSWLLDLPLLWLRVSFFSVSLLLDNLFILQHFCNKVSRKDHQLVMWTKVKPAYPMNNYENSLLSVLFSGYSRFPFTKLNFHHIYQKRTEKNNCYLENLDSEWCKRKELRKLE